MIWCGSCTFLVSGMMAVFVFCRNLWNIVKLKMMVSDSSEVRALMHSQRHFIHLTARYLLLFTIAASSSLLMISISFWTVLEHLHFGIIVAVDVSINVLMLYLQFAFASAHYQCICGRLNECCVRLLSANISKAILKGQKHNAQIELVVQTAPRTPISRDIAKGAGSVNEQIESPTVESNTVSSSRPSGTALKNAEILRMISVVECL